VNQAFGRGLPIAAQPRGAARRVFGA